MGTRAVVVSGASGFARPAFAPDALRWRALCLAVGGGMLCASGLYGLATALGAIDPLAPGYKVYADKYLWVRWFHRSFALFGLFGGVLGAVGFSGLCLLLAGRQRLLAAVGALLAVAASAVVLTVWAYDTVAYPFGLSEGLRARLLPAGLVGFYLGFMILGAAALWVRGLGRWRYAVLALGLGGMFAALVPVVLLVSPPVYSGSYEGWPLVTINLSRPLWQALSGLGWLLLARPLVRTPGRERSIVEAENLALARRLYHGAWVGNDLAVVDELAAPYLADHYGGGCGPESLKRSIAGLRKSFDDLRFVVEGQEAEGDRVTTRWTASGTDGGGVLWYPPTGRCAEFRGSFVDRFEGGKLVEHRGEADTEGLLRQLGLPRG